MAMPSAFEFEAAHNYPRDPLAQRPLPPLPAPKLPRVVHSAKLALSQPPDQVWSVQGILPRPSLTLLVGEPGSKKSLLAIDLAVSVSLGLPWLDCAVQQSPILFVDEEAGIHRLWKRLNSALTARNATPETPFHFIAFGGFDLRFMDEAAEIAAHARELQAGLIVIDALADVMRGSDENSVLTATTVFYNLRNLAQLANAAVVVIHHTNKRGIFRGSSAILAGVDHMIHVASPAASAELELRTLKARDIDPISITARATFSEGRFSVTRIHEPSEPAPTSAPDTVAYRILDFLKLGNATATEISRGIKAKSASTVRQTIYDLHVAGLLARVDDGVRGQTATYTLTDKGKRHVESQSPLA